MKITNIKKVGKKYKLVFDNNSDITTYDDVIIENHLLFNKDVDYDLLRQIEIDNIYYDAYYKTINLITKKLRSLKEINIYLDKYNVDLENKNKIINHLKQIGLINDYNFAKAFINDKLYLSNDGPSKIKKNLLEHDIQSSTIEELIEPLKEEFNKKLTKLITKKIKNNTKYGGYYLKQKITNELINLGYDYSDINTFYNEDLVTYDYEKEYDKLYKKYSKKYDGEQLDRIIKQKLYQKGIESNDLFQ